MGGTAHVRVTLGVALLSASCVAGCLTERSDGDHSAAPPTLSERTPSVPAAATREAREPPGSQRAPKAPAASPLRRPYNVVLILIDSLRADMPWTGYERDIAPWMTAFARRSVVYTHAYSLSAYTAKSVGALLAGRYPSEMRRNGKFFEVWIDADNLFLSERVKAAGHRALGGHAHGYFAPSIGINQGFDDWQLLPGGTGVTQAAKTTSEPLTELAIRMLSKPENVSQENGKRFFAYFHYMDPHFEYEPHPEHPDYGPRPRDRYDTEVHFTDAWVGKLVDWIQSQPFGENTAVIISADHGEAFGEHGFRRHAYELWEAVVRVPLLVHVPGIAPRRIDARRSHLDLAPTIADLMEVPAEPPFRGQSLVPELAGAPVAKRRVVVDLPRCNLQDRRRAVITEDGSKIIGFGDDVRFELYDLEQDPEETHELSRREPERLAQAKRNYEAVSADVPLVEVTGSHDLKGAPPGRKW